MTVYIDVLIVLNVYISYFSLRAAARLLHTFIPPGRLAGAAVFGGFSSLAALTDAGVIVSIALRAGLTAVMVLIAFGFGSARKLLLRSLICAGAGMLVSGAAAMLHELTGSSFIFCANGYAYMSVSALVLVTASAVIYGGLSLLRRFLDSPAADKPVTLRITDRGKTAVMTALADSGNNARDFLTGLPVVICKRSAVENILPANLIAFLGGNTDDLTGIRLIPLTTAAGGGVAAAFRPESITAFSGGEEKQLDALVAVCGDALENEDFDALISPKLLG